MIFNPYTRNRLLGWGRSALSRPPSWIWKGDRGTGNGYYRKGGEGERREGKGKDISPFSAMVLSIQVNLCK